MPLTEVQNLVETRLAQKISQIPGVGLVTLSAAASARRCASRPNPQALASLGLGLDELRTAIANANANAAKGSFDGPTRAYTINANDQLLTVDDYRELDHRVQEQRAGATSRRAPTSSTAPRTSKPRRVGEHADPRSSSTCSASPAPT